jgi:hypothetical protein
MTGSCCCCLNFSFSNIIKLILNIFYFRLHFAFKIYDDDRVKNRNTFIDNNLF